MTMCVTMGRSGSYETELTLQVYSLWEIWIGSYETELNFQVDHFEEKFE